ncbi:SDR family NAD(P)-dependent oxidoreductase [Micromonosporaceae bacterium Da 78-11]
MASEDKLREYLKRATVELSDTRRRLAEAEQGRHEPIAIVGLACRYPGADSDEEFWELLSDGRTGITEVPASRWNVDDYYDPDRRAAGGIYTRHGGFLGDIAGWDAGFFGVSPQEALRMDPHQRLLMELLWDGLENAAIDPGRVAGSRTAVLVGYMDSMQYGRLETEAYGPTVTHDPYFGQGVSPSVVAGRLAYQFDLRGPTATIDTACSSSLVGVHLAAEALRRGECDLAVAAGAYLIVRPDTYVQACATSMLSPDGRCKTFDRSADGYVLGEGGGLVVLERLSSALRNGRRIRGVLRGSAVNQDGRSNGLTAPSRGAQVDVIRRAQAAAGVEPDEVDFVEAHGSGTQLGDAIELSALHDVFGKRSPRTPLHVGAVKTNIGHTQSAAGVAGLIKTILSLEHGELPPNLHLSDAASAVPADGTVRPAGATVVLPVGERARIAGVSSFGWSGTNAHLVVEAPPGPATGADQADQADRRAYALPVSAAGPAALRAQLRRLAGWLDRHPGLTPADVEHTLGSGRGRHDWRRVVLCTGRDDAIRRLAAAATEPVTVRAGDRARVAYLLPGTGDQYPGLGAELYRGEPVYAAAVDECVALVERRDGLDLRPLFAPAEPSPAVPLRAASGDLAALLGRTAAGEDDGDRAMRDAVTAHPFQFIVEYALARLLGHRGVQPDLLIGYSLGEYVAACLAGVFTLDDALHLVVERARLIAAAPAGRMTAAATGEAPVRAAIAATGAEVDVAALNGPAMTVLSGTAAGITLVTERLAADGVACRPLRSDHAFHSSLLTVVRDKLAALVASVPRQAPAVTVVANRTGRALTAAEATDPQYWADHLISPVRFAQSIEWCAGHGVDVFVELGAGQTLGGLVRQNLTAADAVTVVGTLPGAWTAAAATDGDDWLLAVSGRLWEAGVDVDWPATHGDQGRPVTLPGYPFQRTRFWPDGDGVASVPVPVNRPPADLLYAPTWQGSAVRPPTTASAWPGPLVVLADPGGIGTALADLAVAAGVEVVEVTRGNGIRRTGRLLTIDPTDPEQYREIFAGLVGGGPVQVVHLWGVAAADSGGVFPSDERLRASIRDGFDPLLLVLQAMGERPAACGVHLITASRGALEVLGDDVTAPDQAAAHGLARVAQHEYAGLSWAGVDLDPAATTGDAARHLTHELTGAAREPYGSLVGWRRDRRWSRSWAQVTEPAGAEPGCTEPVWRPDGVYLITGGTRGLGLLLARHLARSGVRRLALVSRTALAGAGDERAERTRADVAELEAAGVRVLLLAADAGVPDELRGALRRCREHFGALHGVVHAAGVPAGGMLARGTVASAAAVLAPKVLATGPLAELVGPGTPAEERPELLVLYSSAITTFGGIGEGDYCAANTVLDAYGAALSAAAPSTRVLTVAWGQWQHDAWQGAAGSALAERATEYRRRYGFADEAGCLLLDRAVRTRHGSLVAVRQPMDEALRDWTAMLDLDTLVGAGAARPPAERFPRPQLRAEFVAPRTELEKLVAGVWEAYLGIDRVGVHDPFFDLGGNSLVGMAMVLAVEKQLGASIAPAVLFEHPTVAEFAAALDGAAGDDDPQDLLAISSDRGSRRRRARAGTRK